MDPVELYRLLGRKPFQPLRVVLKDGRCLPITTRRFAIVGLDHLNIGYQAAGYDDGIWGGYEHLRLQDVIRVEPLIAPPNAASS